MRLWVLDVKPNVRAAIVLALLLTGTGCTDQFTDRYATLQEARRNQAFERGWLPDVLPSSSHALRVSGDIDINTAQDEFSFRATEFEEFVARLQPTPKEIAPDAVERIRDLEHEGYVARAYVHEQYTWVFLCSREREHCEYYGWPER